MRSRAFLTTAALAAAIAVPTSAGAGQSLVPGKCPPGAQQCAEKQKCIDAYNAAPKKTSDQRKRAYDRRKRCLAAIS